MVVNDKDRADEFLACSTIYQHIPLSKSGKIKSVSSVTAVSYAAVTHEAAMRIIDKLTDEVSSPARRPGVDHHNL